MKKNVLNLTKQCNNVFLSKETILIACIFVSSFLHAQDKTQDNFINSDVALLDHFYASKGTEIISFDASNIKQFWIDNSVFSKNSLINIILDNDKDKAKNLFSSDLLRIKLANVSVTQDCIIDVISEDSNITFAVKNDNNEIISSSNPVEQFVNYSIISSSFHLSDTQDFTFYLQFSSNTSPNTSVNKIVLSFQNDKTFLSSPGKVQLTDSDFLSSKEIRKIDDKSFSMKGVNGKILSKKRIIVSDNTIRTSVSIKNVGDVPTTVTLGYVPYTNLGQRILSNCYPFNDEILTVLSSQVKSNTILVDKLPEWKKGCYLALNAKSDLSDIPCFNFVPGKVVEIIEKENSQAEIILDKPLESLISNGTQLRLHSPDGASYIYVASKLLQPGESTVLSSSTKKIDDLLQYSRKGFSRDVSYVIPVVLSRSGKDVNIISITDFTISF